MRSLLIEGQLILEALQQDTQSDFDLLWKVLQSSEVQGYISEHDINRLFVEMARSQGVDIASSMTHHLSKVLIVCPLEEIPDVDCLISTTNTHSNNSNPEIEATDKLPILSVSAYLERLTLDLQYRDQLANSKNHRVLSRWLRKYSEASLDAFLAIPLALTFLMQGLGVFDKLLGLDSGSPAPGDRPFSFPSMIGLNGQSSQNRAVDLDVPHGEPAPSLKPDRPPINRPDLHSEFSPLDIRENSSELTPGQKLQTSSSLHSDILDSHPLQRVTNNKIDFSRILNSVENSHSVMSPRQFLTVLSAETKLSAETNGPANKETGPIALAPIREDSPKSTVSPPPGAADPSPTPATSQTPSQNETPSSQNKSGQKFTIKPEGETFFGPILSITDSEPSVDDVQDPQQPVQSSGTNTPVFHSGPQEHQTYDALNPPSPQPSERHDYESRENTEANNKTNKEANIEASHTTGTPQSQLEDMGNTQLVLPLDPPTFLKIAPEEEKPGELLSDRFWPLGVQELPDLSSTPTYLSEIDAQEPTFRIELGHQTTPINDRAP